MNKLLTTFRGKLILMFLSALTLSLILNASVLYPTLNKEWLAHEEEKITIALNALTHHLDTEILQAEKELTAISSLGDITSGNKAKIDLTLSHYDRTSNYFYMFTMMDKEGIILSRPSNPGRIGKERSDREYFKITKASLRPYVSKIYVATAGHLAMTITVPVVDEGNDFIGVLMGSMGLMDRNPEMYHSITDASAPDHWEILLVSGGGQLIAQKENKHQLQKGIPGQDYTRHPSFILAQEKTDRASHYKEKQKRFSSQSTHLKNTDWFLIINIPSDRILHIVRTQTAWIAISIFLFTVVLMLAALIIFNRFIKPLNQLTSGLISFGKTGKGKPISNAGKDEVAQSIKAFNKMIEDRAQLESKLVQAQKMEAIGTLSGGIAHDFNNILSAIIGYTDLAMMEVEKDSKAIESLIQVKKAGNRATDLVRQILTFGRGSKQEKCPINVGLIIKEALKLLRSSIPSTIEIKQDIESTAVVMADPTHIHQVIMNLCTNAYHSMRQTGGTLEIKLQDIKASENITQKNLELEPCKYTCLSVSDTGTGISDSIIDKIFEPYFTSKEKGEGTGLGLAVVHGIVEDHNGKIEILSKEGQGTTFHIYLPTIEQSSVESVFKEDKQESLRGGNETIMVVDDEDDICHFLESALKQYGYQVYTYQNGLQALQDFKKEPDRYDLVLSDVTMPYMTGDILALKLLEIKPSLSIILCTGHSDLINKEKALQLGAKELCDKPLTVNQIIKTVRNVLDTCIN